MRDVMNALVKNSSRSYLFTLLCLQIVSFLFALPLDARGVLLLGMQVFFLAGNAVPLQSTGDGQEATGDAEAVSEFSEGGIGLGAN